MVSGAEYRVILVVKKSRYESASKEARELIQRDDPSVRGWVGAHDRHYASLDKVEKAIEDIGFPTKRVTNPYDSFNTAGKDVVIVVGGDGTFLAASHSVGDLPMLGVNSDPESSRGFFCGTDADGTMKVLRALSEGRASSATIQRMEVAVNVPGEREQWAVRSKRVLNEALLCHPHPAATSRFSVSFDGPQEWDQQMSSGAWIGPPAGTTGAMRSAGGDLLPIEARLIQYVSRETVSGRARRVVTDRPVLVRIRTDVAAAYMDGPYKQAELRLGQTVRLSLSSEPLTVVGIDGRR